MVTFAEVFMCLPAVRRIAVSRKASTGERNPVNLTERRHSMIKALTAFGPGVVPDRASVYRPVAV
jgi:hypothetical protein